MRAWEGVFSMPEPGRTSKPRTAGYTMVLDKGLGLNATRDLMDTAADYVDALKQTFGTSAFYSERLLREKIGLVRGAGVDIYPGGTFLEVAVAEGRYPEFLKYAKEVGFNAIEVSDGTMEMPGEVRQDCIKRAVDAGFKVISEVGKKDPNVKVAMAKMHEQIESDLELGAFKVIVEARESGKGVGIFDKSGKVQESEVDLIIAGVKDVNDLIWEAPSKDQYQYLIMRFGINVNLGNIPADDILACEALRSGLRGDTLKRALERGIRFTG